MFAQRLTVALVALLSINAYAADSNTAATPNTSSASGISFKDKYLKNIGAGYAMEILGANTQSLTGSQNADGSDDGKGNQMTVRHLPNVNYKFKKPGITLGFTGHFLQTFNGERTNDMISFRDPYVTVSKADLYKNEAQGVNVFGYLRYYIPASNDTKDKVKTGSPDDKGNGMVRAVLAPSKTFANGKLEFSLANSFYYSLAKNSDADRIRLGKPAARNDMQFYYSPNLSWSATPKVQPFIEYFSGLMVHSTSGTWLRNRKHPALGEYINVGANLFPTKRLSISPQIAWGPKFVLNQAGIAVLASLKLL